MEANGLIQIKDSLESLDKRLTIIESQMTSVMKTMNLDENKDLPKNSAESQK